MLAVRSVFDSLDGIDTMSDDITNLMPELDKLDVLTAQLRTLMPPMIESMESMKTLQLTMQSTQKGMYDQMDALQSDQSAMGKAFDQSKNDDSFYLPPEAFDNPDFKRGMKMFLSPDGHAVRFIISHEGDPMSPQGLKDIDTIRNAAFEAIRAHPWKVRRSTSQVPRRCSRTCSRSQLRPHDRRHRGTVPDLHHHAGHHPRRRGGGGHRRNRGSSPGTLFGLSVLIWQDLIGQPLHWMVLAMSVIILLAVGSDYTTCCSSPASKRNPRRPEHRHHQGNGRQRLRGDLGGLVFALTMASMAFSELRILAQVGTTIGLGLMFDTLIIRSFMTPSIAALLGRWFWWPQRVRPRPVPQRWPPAPGAAPKVPADTGS